MEADTLSILSSDGDAFAAFSRQPEPAGIIYPASWQKLSQTLNHFAQFGGGVHVVNAPFGAGKSTFLLMLKDLIADDQLKSTFDIADTTTPESVLERLLQLMAVPLQGGQALGGLIVALRAQVALLRREQRRAVIIADNGHMLDDASLTALLSILQGTGDEGFGLHVIFLAEPGLADRMDALGIVDLIVHDNDLPPFTASEVDELLKAVFMAQGEGSFLLSDDEVSEIFSISAGLPWRVIELAEEKLVQKNMSTSGFSGLPLVHIVAVVTLLVILLIAFLWSRSGDGTHSLSNPAPEQTSLVSRQEGDVDIEIERPIPEGGVVISEEVEGESSGHLGGGDVKAISPAKIDAPLAKKTRLVEVPVETGQPKLEATRVSKQNTPSVQPTLTASEQALLRYDSSGYVLQLMAASAELQLKQYLNSQNSDKLKLYRGLREGKRWYIIVQGYYSDRRTALSAIAKLPKSQRVNRPWPKPVAHVHKEIKAFSHR